MRLSKISYFSELFFYPVMIVILILAGLAQGGLLAALEWVAICAFCVALWTFIEYAMHRFAFHHVPFVRDMHHQHHIEERAYIGTPLWVSLSAHFTIAFLPIWLVSGFWLASAASCGLAIGYIWYVAIHHILHHWHPRHSGYFYNLKRHHALHHHVAQTCNFGVTTGIWDRVFGTLEPRESTRSERLASTRVNGAA
jgi:sterol desaturase/sphingolipid hydroxylase (fatty acid hydroxylase superfamily)